MTLPKHIVLCIHCVCIDLTFIKIVGNNHSIYYLVFLKIIHSYKKYSHSILSTASVFKIRKLIKKFLSNSLFHFIRT